VMIGLCGGYTTFSSFSLQTLDLLREGATARAAINIAASVVLCILAVAAGHLIATQFNGDTRIAQVSIEEENNVMPPADPDA
jgi:fluoride exporter